jgi:acyl-CoA synthetase (AMP-forming)/AMP-acid ligase II
VAALPAELPVGEVGEIVTRSDCVMEGYWDNPEATAETLRGGWLHTGDLGSFDEDGFLTLRDRSKDMIISGGSNIYPREIEEVLLRHPDLVEVSVVGRPDREWGEEVVAFVVARPGADIAAEALDRLCLDHIARFKRPRHYRFVGRPAAKQLRQGAEDRIASAVGRACKRSERHPLNLRNAKRPKVFLGRDRVTFTGGRRAA